MAEVIPGSSQGAPSRADFLMLSKTIKPTHKFHFDIYSQTKEEDLLLSIERNLKDLFGGRYSNLAHFNSDSCSTFCVDVEVPNFWNPERIHLFLKEKMQGKKIVTRSFNINSENFEYFLED